MKFDPKAISRTASMSKTLYNGAAVFALAALLAVGPAASGLAPAQAESNVVKLAKGGNRQQKITLGLDKSIVLELASDAYDILVANPEVADAVSKSNRRIYLFGKDIGSTNIFVFGKDGEQIANLNLQVEQDTAGLQDNLNKYIEDSDIKIEISNNTMLLTGTVQTAADSVRAEALANAFLTGGGSASLARIAARRAAAISPGGSNNTIVITSASGSDSSAVINLLKILGDDQVTLKVTVAEISRVVMKQLGVDLIAKGSLGGISFSGNVGTLTGLGSSIGAGGQAISGMLGNTTLASSLNAMEQSGVMRTLAEPTLTAISGEKAQFQVGGEFNILTSASRTVDDTTGRTTEAQSYGKISYGIGLEFLPVVLGPGRINLKVRTSVSEPTSEASAQMAGRNVISIRKRLADTTVELPSGGSMMIAGLVRDDVRQVLSGYPGASKIPILGTLFRSRDFVRNETELVIIVTPYLVRPVARNKLNRPDDNFNVASDGAGMFLGKLNKVYGTMKTDRPAGRYHGVVGYIYK
jgi:pilus assembly protein CpaC